MQVKESVLRRGVLAFMLVLLVASIVVYWQKQAIDRVSDAPTAQPLATKKPDSAEIVAQGTPAVIKAAIAPITPIPIPQVQPDRQESYCLWPGDTLSQLALNTGEEITTILKINPGYQGLAGGVIHLPERSISPTQWKQAPPPFKGIQGLPFGVSGYYIGANNRFKRVALTFDIGYVPFNTERMKMLAERGIQATFFVVGDSMSRHPDVIHDILWYDHELGNHSWSHNNMQKMNAAEVIDELQKTEAAVRAANPKATTKPFFRAPFGAINDTIVKAAQSEGYYVIGWTVDSSDWVDGATPDKVYNWVTKNVCPGAIIVMHDINAANYTALPRIIDYLVEQGYTFVPLSKMLAP